MARGFLSGAVVGTLVSAVGLGAASLLGGAAPSGAPEIKVLDVPAGLEAKGLPEGAEAVLPAPDAQPAPKAEPKAAPEVAAPKPDDLTGLAPDAKKPAAKPDTGDAKKLLPPADDGAASADIALKAETPVLPSPQSRAPEAPAAEEGPSAPADEVLPQVGAENGIPEDELAALAEPPAPEMSEEAQSSSIIGNLAPDVTTNRLPSLGDPVEPEPDAGQQIAAAFPDPDVPEAELPALARFAAPFENPEGRPLMSIILIDDGTSPAGLEALESFPYPLSFAVDASRDAAGEAMAAYRAAGFEVLAMVDLPEGAGAQDAEVAMQVVFDRLPETVAVMEGTGTGLQSSREAAGQLAPILLETGHGAVFFPQGLNTAQQLLAREGVPAVAAFRDFDRAGQDATVIRRFLDQAAFKAVQEDAGVVMVGRLRPDTVSALLLWGLQDRAQRVALAPVSALLQGE